MNTDPTVRDHYQQLQRRFDAAVAQGRYQPARDIDRALTEIETAPTAPPTDISAIVCAECAGQAAFYQRSPWCPACRHYLTGDNTTGGWVSYATAEYRLREMRRQRCHQLRRVAVARDMAYIAAVLPAGWTATVIAAGSAIALAPAGREKSVTATLLLALTTTIGWSVLIEDRVHPSARRSSAALPQPHTRAEPKPPTRR